MYTVIVVDDEPLIRCSVIYSLQQNIHNIKVIGEASNGREALTLIDSQKPDIVITDIKMPLMSGLELIQNLKKNKSKAKIIILSGYSDFEYARQAIKYNVFDYVLKPVKAKELKEAIESCIDQSLFDTETERPCGPSEKLITYIDTSFSENLSLDGLSTKFNFSPKYISNLIKAKLGKSFTDYVTDLRITKAVELLTKTNMEIKEISAAIGYEDQQYFHRIFKKKTGQTPTQYRR